MAEKVTVAREAPWGDGGEAALGGRSGRSVRRPIGRRKGGLVATPCARRWEEKIRNSEWRGSDFRGEGVPVPPTGGKEGLRLSEIEWVAAAAEKP